MEGTLESFVVPQPGTLGPGSRSQTTVLGEIGINNLLAPKSIEFLWHTQHFESNFAIFILK